MIPPRGWVTLRPARAADTTDLELLAALDSARMLEGEVIVAELGDRVVAAMSLDRGSVIADPFVRTTALVALLEVRGRQLRRGVASPTPTFGGRLRALQQRLTVRIS